MSNDALSALPPVPETITVAGETLDITPLKVGELPAFARAMRPIIDQLTASPDWVALLSEHGEVVIQALAVACRRPVEWVSGLDLDDAIRLAEAVFEVNANFFIRRIAPEIERAGQKIAQTIGRTHSSGSSGPGTPTQTS